MSPNAFVVCSHQKCKHAELKLIVNKDRAESLALETQPTKPQFLSPNKILKSQRKPILMVRSAEEKLSRQKPFPLLA